jgi:SNF2 family DNA or RNA helicase
MLKRSIAPLFLPHQLSKGEPCFEIIRLTKTKTGTTYVFEPLSREAFKNIPPALGPDLKNFLPAHFTQQITAIKVDVRKERSGQDRNVTFQKAIFRHIYTMFYKLSLSAQGMEFYHQVKDFKNKKQRVGKCSFSREVPYLHFEIRKDAKGALHVEPFITLEAGTFGPEDYIRTEFLMMVSDTYYQLSQADYMILEWLKDRKPELYARKPKELVTHVILRLEEKYKVYRNENFSVTEIRAVPRKAILLSEISGSFLMLTPRWIYDGITVEGVYQEQQTVHLDGEMYVVHRDKEAEDTFLNYLRQGHDSFRRQINGYFHLSFDEAKKKQWFVKNLQQWLENEIEIHGLDMLQHFRYSPHAISTSMKVLKDSGDELEIYLKVSFGSEEIPLKELRRMIMSQQHAVLLKNNTLGLLPEEWLEEYSTLLRHGKIEKNIIKLPTWHLISEEKSERGLRDHFKPIISEEWWSKWTHWQKSDDQLIPVPANLEAELRPYQHKGYEWMMLLSEIGAGAYLADDMGLGKTLQTIAVFLQRLQSNPKAKLLIVCPASLMYNWQKEISKFAPELTVRMYHNQGRNIEKYLKEDSRVLITSYGLMRADIELLEKVMWDTIVLDESHNIKNQNSQTAKAAQLLKARCRIALSGTPVMNNTQDLFPPFNFLLPGYLGTADFFRNEYANPIDKNRDEKKTAALQKLTQPFILRRTKSQVASDLPEKTESVLWCEMDSTQKACYDEVMGQIRSSIFLDIKSKGLSKSKLSVLDGILKLRQVCASPTLLRNLDTFCDSAVKLNVITEEIQRLGDHKALVFSQFKGMLDLIGDVLDKNGIEYFRIDGDVPPEQRQQLVDEFQDADNNIRVFLISLKAGNAGLNLTAADYVFLVDPWWNQAVQQQAIDRTHRIGQDKHVFAYQLICKDSIEEKILLLQEKKKNLSENLVGEEEGFVKQLTEEDVAFLFS